MNKSSSIDWISLYFQILMNTGAKGLKIEFIEMRIFLLFLLGNHNSKKKKKMIEIRFVRNKWMISFHKNVSFISFNKKGKLKNSENPGVILKFYCIHVWQFYNRE